MSDIKLFQIKQNYITELEGKSIAVEKSLQNLIESQLETFLGVKFLASEYSTGQKHGGRIDTLGIDENNCPVIIEYKRSTNENVINQGLFYLDWLLDHKAEFQLLAMKKLGSKTADSIEWNNSRLVCIAGDYTKYDSYAVQQINRNIELLRYKKFENLLLLELVNAVTGDNKQPKTDQDKKHKSKGGKRYATIDELLDKASTEVKDRYESLEAFMLGLGDDVQKKKLLYYYAFKRIKNFASVEIHPQTNTIVVYVRLKPSSDILIKGFTRDVTNIGHLGTGNIEIKISNDSDLERAKQFIIKSYEIG